MKFSIYNTDEENLLLVPQPKSEWFSCEIFCLKEDLDEGISNASHQYEVWKISHDPISGKKTSKLVGVHTFLREAFEQAHLLAAKSKDIQDLQVALKELDEAFLDKEETLEELDEITAEDKEWQEIMEKSLLMGKFTSRSIN